MPRRDDAYIPSKKLPIWGKTMAGHSSWGPFFWLFYEVHKAVRLFTVLVYIGMGRYAFFLLFIINNDDRNHNFLIIFDKNRCIFSGCIYLGQNVLIQIKRWLFLLLWIVCSCLILQCNALPFFVAWVVVLGKC